MIGTSSTKVILKIPVSYITVRHGGVDKKVATLSEGFVDAEYEDGSVFQVTNPIKDWLIDLETRRALATTDTSLNVTVYFQFVSGLPASNPGYDDNGPSLTNDEYSASGVNV